MCQVYSSTVQSQLLLLNDCEAERRKFVAIAMVELVLELNPVQTQCMQER